MTNSSIFWTLLRSNAYEFVQHFVFSCQEKSRDIVYQRTCLLSCLIFAQHGRFGIQLTAYSALSCLADHGIYYVTRCGIWLLTIFHIPYIHFQAEMRKFTSQKLCLSFFLFSILLGWMSCLISFKRCRSSCKKHGTNEHNKKKTLSMVGFEPPTRHGLQLTSPPS